MRIVVQRSKQAHVSVAGQIVGKIEHGLVLLIGITHLDTEVEVKLLANKIAGLRIFDDHDGKMNVSIQDHGGQILSISQFTLYGDCSKGKRPNFMQAARSEVALGIYEAFNQELRHTHGLHVETGQFGAMMDVTLTNWGPVTLILDSQA